MKRVYVNEKWCIGCHLCEYNCAFANTGEDNMAAALMDVEIRPRIHIEGDQNVTYAVNCRHCPDAICIKSCIAGALSKTEDGVVTIDKTKCVGCHTCVVACPFGALVPSEEGTMTKCELCTQNGGTPACVSGCPNNAIVFEEEES